MAKRWSFKTFLKKEGGATAIEFALVAGPFFWFFLSMFETGLMLFTDYALQSGTQQAARLMRTGQMQTGALPSQFQDKNFKEIVCEQSAIIIGCESKLSVKVQSLGGKLADFKATVPNVLSVGPTVPGGSPTYACKPGKPLDNVVVIVTYDWKYFLPFMNSFSNIALPSTRRLVGYAMYQNEPYQWTGTGSPGDC